MPIQVKFFASLADRVGKREDTVLSDDVSTAMDVWTASAANEPMPGNTRVAINQHYATLTTAVADGDEVAFFPPVTGG